MAKSNARPNPKDAVEKRQSTLPSTIDYSADAGKGMETASRAAFLTPFIMILQANSPLVESVDDAKAGMFINNITNELSKELLVIPCYFQQQYLRWAPRSAGGGFRGAYKPSDVELNKIEGMTMDKETGRPIIGEDELKDTRQHYCLVQSASGSWSPAIIALSSTQVKKSRRWMSRMDTIEAKDSAGKTYHPPSFANIYRIKPIKEENNEGAWWGYDINLDSPVTDPEVYEKARAFHKTAAAGDIEISAPVPEGGDGAAGNGKGGKF